MPEEKRLRDHIQEINERLDKQEKIIGEKKFKKAKLGKAKAKKGYVVLQTIHPNNTVRFRQVPIVNGNIHLGEKEEDTYHLADAEYIGSIDGKLPLVILPTWSNEPITKEVLTRKIDENKSTIKPQKQIIHLMEDARLAEQMKPKKSMKGVVMIGLILLILYIIGRGQGWF